MFIFTPLGLLLNICMFVSLAWIKGILKHALKGHIFSPIASENGLTQVAISPSVYFERSPELWAIQCGVNGLGLFSSHCTHKHIQQNSLWSSADRQHQLRLPRSRTVCWVWVGHIPAKKLNKISVLISVRLNILQCVKIPDANFSLFPAIKLWVCV